MLHHHRVNILTIVYKYISLNLKISQNFNERIVFEEENYGFHLIHIAQIMNYRTLNSDAERAKKRGK